MIHREAAFLQYLKRDLTGNSGSAADPDQRQMGRPFAGYKSCRKLYQHPPSMADRCGSVSPRGSAVLAKLESEEVLSPEEEMRYRSNVVLNLNVFEVV